MFVYSGNVTRELGKLYSENPYVFSICAAIFLLITFLWSKHVEHLRKIFVREFKNNHFLLKIINWSTFIITVLFWMFSLMIIVELAFLALSYLFQPVSDFIENVIGKAYAFIANL